MQFKIMSGRLFQITTGPEKRFTFVISYPRNNIYLVLFLSYQLVTLSTFTIVKSHSKDMCLNRGGGHESTNGGRDRGSKYLTRIF